MTRLEKELANLTLEEEKRILKEIEQQYKQAMQDIEDKIAELLARTDLENVSSIIYQLKYQNALKDQIGAILDNLRVNQYTSIMDYLQDCYNNGFIGTLYDLQNQGIPFIFPIDQEQMIKAILTDSKISEGLYERLGMDVKELKKEIRYEISRGIANNFSYDQIARLIRIKGDIFRNKAFRIARTEGHRIQEAAQFDAQLEAKDNGADIVKQWDATLDKRTRRAHAELDGQIKEVDEPFEYNGHTAMFPGDFGVASMDVNCRCSIIQRAKWALDEAELETLKTRAAYYGLDKTENFEEYKTKYLQATENAE